MPDIFSASLLTGMFSGFLAGLFGIGGGIVIVPILVFLFSSYGLANDLIMIMATATSLAAIVLTSISSVIAHHRLGSVLWDKVFRLMPGIMSGSILGTLVADYIRSEYLRIIFIAFLLFVGTQMALEIKPKPNAANRRKSVDFWVAGFIGLLSSLVGIGGGTLTVPYLTNSNITIRNAVAIASACGLPIAIAGSVGYIFLGVDAPKLPNWSFGYVYLPAFLGVGIGSIFTAPLGAKLAHRLPAKKLRRYFSLLIFVFAFKLIWH